MKPNIKIHNVLNSIYDGANLGEIYRAKNNENQGGITDHYFIVYDLDDPDQSTFLGVMLTSSTNPEFDNIEIPEEYFKAEADKNSKYEFPQRTTLFTEHKRIKLNEWAPFYLVGELTQEGFEFIKSKLDDLDPTEFEHNKTYRKI